jgi:hypothetical protein
MSVDLVLARQKNARNERFRACKTVKSLPIRTSVVNPLPHNAPRDTVLPARRDFGFRRAAVLAVSRIHGQLLAEMERMLVLLDAAYGAAFTGLSVKR